jgi:4-diphosphocytidyl-2-C-methyl-D-erythritol kinase
VTQPVRQPVRQPVTQPGACVRVAAPAKINLCLGVGPVRSDGYHPLATVYQAVALYDELELRAVDGASELTVVAAGDVDVTGVPTDAGNLVLRALDVLGRHHGRTLAASVVLHKRIPVAGGLAGGSTDGAAALVGADALFGLRTPRPVLLELAAGLGSDVPFCLVGGTAAGAGRGELVTEVPTAATSWWVVVPDAAGLSTPAVYAAFDRLAAERQRTVPAPVVPPELLAALATGDPAALGAALGNDLQPAALAFRPDLAVLLEAGCVPGPDGPGALGALVSGSGPTTAFLCRDRSHAERVAARPALGRGERPLVLAAPAPGARVVAEDGRT